MTYAAKPTRSLTSIAVRIEKLPLAFIGEGERATLAKWTLATLNMSPGDRACGLRDIAARLRVDAQVHDDADNMSKAALVRKVAADLDAVWQRDAARVEAMINA